MRRRMISLAVKLAIVAIVFYVPSPATAAHEADNPCNMGECWVSFPGIGEECLPSGNSRTNGSVKWVCDCTDDNECDMVPIPIVVGIP
jgi:hypothetical protein